MGKKIMSLVAVFIAVSMVFAAGCANQKKSDVIEEVTESNVEQITSEYKMILAYFQELKSNLEELSAIRKSDTTSNSAEDIKANLIKNREELETNAVKFMDLIEAKQNLIKAYKVVEDAADKVDKDVEIYDKDIEEYKAIFEVFNKQMTSARIKIEAVKSEKADELNDPSKETKEDPKKEEDKKDKESKENKDNEGDKQENKENNPPVTSEDPGKDKVSSKLNESLKNDIYNAGLSAGQNYKADGGQGDIQSEAARQFDGLEGDNPIDADNISEAKRIFINAFIKGYNS